MKTKDTNTAATISALGAKAKQALADATSLSAEVETKLRMTREAWRTFGQALLDARAVMPDKVAFGRWVRAHGLDQGLAKRPATRSDAQWLAERWDVLQRCKTITQHHPTGVRKQWEGLQKFANRRARHSCFGFPPDLQNAVMDLHHFVAVMASVAEHIRLEQYIAPSNIEMLEEQAVKLPGAIRRVAALRHLQAPKGQEQEPPAAASPTPPVAAAESADETRPAGVVVH